MSGIVGKFRMAVDSLQSCGRSHLSHQQQEGRGWMRGWQGNGAPLVPMRQGFSFPARRDRTHAARRFRGWRPDLSWHAAVTYPLASRVPSIPSIDAVSMHEPCSVSGSIW